MAKEIFEVEEKIAVGKDVAAIKKYKDFRERNEEVYKLAIAVAAKAIQKENLNAAAMALAQANAATAQIKPIGSPEGEKGEPKESGFLKGYMAKAEAFYGNKQTGIPVGTTKPSSGANTVLVDSGEP